MKILISLVLFGLQFIYVNGQTPPGQPEITAPETFILGNTYSLSCSSTGGSPPTTVSFLKDNTVISTTTNSLNTATTTDTYTFTAARDDHFEVFECQVDNNVIQNPLSTTLFVTVNFAPQPPTITGPNTLTQGDQGTWTCLSTDGYPTPTMTARIGNTQFTTGFTTTSVLTNQAYTVNGTLIWSPTTANNGQSLCCVVSHSVLSTPQTACLTLTVNSPLAINAPVLQYNPTIGTNVVLRCEITAGTATNVKWFKDSSELNIGGNSRLSVGTNTVPSLTITGVVQSDQGGYVCQATDGTATVNTATINVNPQGTPPVVTLPQTVYSQITGNSVTLQCTVSSPNSPLQEVQWRFTNQAGVTIDPIIIPTGTNPKYQGSSTTSPALMINNVQSTDQGSYQCRARNLIGTTLSTQSAALTVTGSLPVVQVPTPTYSVVYGSQVTLACNIVSASPAVSNVYWTKISNGVTSTINNGAAGTQGITPSSPSLTINFATTSDEGTYRCYATNAVGTGQSVTTTQLTVTGGTLTIGISPAADTVIQGTTKVITCSVSGQPSATSISWTKGGFPLTISSSGGKYSGGTPSVPHLTINNFQSSDAATYTCSATNVAGTVTSGNSVLSFLGLLTVTVSPSTNTVTLGDASVTIQCSVSGSTQATSWEWTKNPIAGGNTEIISQGTNNGDRQVVNSATNPNLILTGITESDEGVYRCRANNGAGLVTSNPSTLVVQGGIPSVNVEPSQYTGTIGDASYQIQCTVTAVPEATSWYWTFTPIGGSVVNIPQGTNNANYMMDNSPTKPHLTIKTLASSDAGDYKCFAVNQAGQSSSSNSRLNVVGDKPTVNISPATANVVNGNTQFISCTVTATPAVQSVTWYKNGAVLNPSSNTAKYSGGTAQVPSLTISNFQSTDSGTYYCTATNAAGTGTSLPDTSVLTYVDVPTVSLTTNIFTVDYGNDVILGCTVSANPTHTSVYWQKIVPGGNPITINLSNTNKYGGSSPTNPSLTIKNTDTNDQGKYVCFAANSVGTGQSSEGRLDVIGTKPVVTIPQSSYTINIGNSITIGCTINSNPAHTNVYWTKKIGTNPEQTITTGGSPTKYGGSTPQSPALIIYNVEESDAAQYNCYATNLVGTGSSSTPTTLNVIGNIPEVSASVVSSVRLGESVTIECDVTANPDATDIKWQFVTSSSISNIDIANNNRYTGGSPTVPNLTINPVQESDEGNYRCQATNNVGTGTSNQVFLDTTGDPPQSVAITPSPITVTEGNTITATCTATGNPNPTFEWTKSGSNTVIKTGSVLQILNAQESHRGDYICKASNSFGSNTAQVNVDVQFIPKVTITDQAVEGKRGASAIIPCEFNSNPFATKVEWTKFASGTTVILNVDGSKYQGATLSNPSLTIYDLDSNDAASYRCEVTNSVGTGKSEYGTLTVDLTFAPQGINIYPGQITVLEGNSFSIYCNATANPAPSYEWYHDDNMLHAGQTLTISVSDYNQHDGLYTCKAFNSAGLQQATIDVDVKYPPISAVTQNSFNPTLGNGVTLTCDTLANPSAISWQWKYNTFNLEGADDKTYFVDMDSTTDAGQYSCIAYNEVGQSSEIVFTVNLATVTTAVIGSTPAIGEVASAGLTGGEIAAIALGILFFILLLIVLLVCCVLQGCCAFCFGAGAGREKEKVTPDTARIVDVPRFYEVGGVGGVPTVVTSEPGYYTEYGDERYVTSAARPYYLPAIEYTYDDEERRRRHRKKKRSRRHDELQREEQIVLEERVVGGGDVYHTTRKEEEVVAGPEFYFEAE